MDNISYDARFLWPVPRRTDKGYHWVDGRLEPKPGARFHNHEPDKQAALWLIFSRTPSTPESVLDFANHYGLLGNGAIGPDGETIESWRRAIAWFNLLETLWEAAHNSLADFIQEQLRWGKDYVAFDALPLIPGVLSGKPVRLDRHALRKAGIHRDDTDRVARVFVAEVLNAARPQCAPYTLFVASGERRRLIAHYRIQSLFGLLVAQFDQSVQRVGSPYHECAVCGRWYILEPGVNRADRLTCSDACRQKSHRLRRRLALLLHAEGRAIEEIATRTGSSVETVAKWIKSVESSKFRKSKEP